jgi:glycosyltransferase involved in cell wall biosynthesis
MSEPVRVLQIIPALNFGGGMENYVMNYYRHIDTDAIQFDFITHTDLEASFAPEIEALGGRIYKRPPFSGAHLSKTMDQIGQFFEKNKEYQIIHCHMANASPFYFYEARKYGVEHLILHSHQPSAADKLTHKIRNLPLLKIGNHMATDRVACSDIAGKFLFGRKPFTIIKNAIDVNKFKYNPNVREEVRKELGIKDEFVIGHIGRLTAQKNQLFLLKIFEEVLKIIPNSILVMAGDGEDRELIETYIRTAHLESKVKMLGIRSDADRLYQAFDYFVFPSLYEGLGIVLIEAQCAGLKILTSSEKIPHEVKLTERLDFNSLNKGPHSWAEHIIHNMEYERKSDLFPIQNAGYDINREAHKLEQLYLKMVDR